ncbi:TolC family outer membrane protein [uncultured Lamprocystis sp.]|jgi:outer membrane protein|uniref:TolC family outer membrane protein n=1 Tax=uncultured Lamprocystis sp. TaxID=543132 RepID=UPI0025EB2E9C|nr:TolC family outer membrane protein [uncultured Lamprocystis sp.]
MRNSLTLLIAALLAAPAALVTSAARADDLLQIYDIAVQSDPLLREAEQRLFATKEIEPQARALLLPNVALQGTVDYNNLTLSGRGVPGGNRSDRFVTQGVQAVVNQTVYNRANWMTLKQTGDTIAQAEAQYRNTQIELMVRTTQAYFNVLQAADAVTVSEALVRADERQLEQSKQRFEVGLVAITDVNDSQASYDRSKANLITAKRTLDNAWEALRVIVGPLNVPLARLGDTLPLSPPEPNDVQAWADSARRNNFGIIASTEAVAAAKVQIEIAKSGFYPTVGLQAGYDIARSGAENNTDSNTAFVGLTLNVPLYQGGAVVSQTRQAGYNFRAAQDQLDQTRRLVDQQVKDAFRGIVSSIEDVKARQAAVVSARSSLESTEAGLEVGTRTQVDVLNAQRQLFQAEFDYLSSRYTYIINGVKLHQATSTLSREVLAKGNAWLKPSDLVPPPAY